MAHRRSRGVGTMTAVLLAGLLVWPAWSTAAAEGRHTYTGTINGADYTVEVPERWNGTLVLYSHGYYPPFFSPDYTMPHPK